MILIAEQKVFPRSVFVVMQTIIGALVSLFCIVVLNMDWQGRLLGIIIASLAAGIVGYCIVKGSVKESPTMIQKDFIQDALRFGLPFVPYLVCGQIIIGVDRFFINTMKSVSDTGIYTVGFQMGLVISLVTSAFCTVWLPYFYRLLSENREKSKVKIVKLTYLSSLLIVGVALIWGIVAPYVVNILFRKEYFEASGYIIWIALAYAFQGIYSIITGYILYVQKTYLLPIIFFVVTIVKIVSTYILILINGVIGAAQATFITYLLCLSITWFVSAKIYKMPWGLSFIHDQRHTSP
jgi:O-antigen/teichoic acid export membrane protein